MVKTQVRRIVSLTFIILGLLSVIKVNAQVTTADVVGKVTDTNGSAMPGAKVVIENKGTGDVRTIQTDESGDYVFSLLPIGRYTIRVEISGFKTFLAPEIVLASGDRIRVDAPMQVGQVSETVEVSAESLPALQTESSTIGALVNEKAVQDLPINGRNFITLAQLVPGANPGPPTALSSGNRPDDRRRTSTVSVNGQRDIVNNYLIDGVDNNDRVIGTIIVKPSIDAIAEFRVQTNLYTAEVGRTAGGVINLITKSGTNEFHGSVFEFFRNEKLDARDFFAPAGAKPKLRQNQFGGSLGGPIFKDRTFFFGDIERFKQDSASVATVNVLTTRMKTGDFGELCIAGFNASGICNNLVQQIYDPFNARAAFANNLIPSNRFNQIAVKYLAIMPTPTRSGLANNFTSAPVRNQSDYTFDARIDHRFTPNDNFYGRFSFNNTKTHTPGPLPAVNGIEPNGSRASFTGDSHQRSQGTHLNYLHIFNPNLLLEMKAAYARYTVNSNALNTGKNVSSDFGIIGANFDENTTGLSLMSPAGFADMGDSNFLPIIQVSNTYEFGGALTYTMKSHNLKFGSNFKNRQFVIFQSANPLGNYTYNANQTNNGAGTGGHSIASFLLGVPATVVRANSLVYPGYQVKEFGIFVQDDWKFNSWLTINAGVRYDIFTPFSERTNRISNLDLATATILIAGQNSSATTNIKTDYSNLAPRFGFAAILGKGLVLRGGYGISFFQGNYTSNAQLKNQPFTGTFNVVNSNTGAPTYTLSNPLPLPTLGTTVPTGTISAMALDFKSTYVQQYNLMVQKELKGNVLSASYVGALGRREARLIPNLNLALPGAGAINPRRIYAATMPNVTTIAYLDSGGTSNYHALQLAFERRFNKGLTINSNYTWAHGIDDVQLIGGGRPTASGYGALVNNLSLERASGDLDIRQRFALMANYELPFFKSSTGFKKHLLTGWQINTIAYYQTGLAFSVTNSAARSNTGIANDRPNQIADGSISNPTIARWFDTSAFVAQTVNTIGTAGRNTLTGPPRRAIDFSIFKQIKITERQRIQLRGEIFNLTNTPNFNLPDALLGSASFGTISTTAPGTTPRQIQLGIKYLF